MQIPDSLSILLCLCVAIQEPRAKPEDLRLFDYKPKSQLQVLSRPIERAKFPAVNVHTHIGNFKTPEQVEKYVRDMDDANVAVTVSLDGMWGETLSNQLKLLTEKHPGRFVVFAQIDYRGDGDGNDMKTWAVNRPDFGDEMAAKLEDAVKRGAKGLKIHKSHGLYYRDGDGKLITVDDPRYDPIWAKCGELGIPVLIHTSDPAAFFVPLDPTNERYEELARHPNWHFYGKDYPSQAELLEARNRVVARHPKTNFIAAHMLNHAEDLQYVAGCLEKYPNLYVETAERIAELGRQPFTARRFFIKYADRILFGTDAVPTVPVYAPYFRFFETDDEYFRYMPTETPTTGRWYIYGINLPDEVLKKVYYLNAAKLIPGVAALLMPTPKDATDVEAFLRDLRIRSHATPRLVAKYVHSDFRVDGDLRKNVWDFPGIEVFNSKDALDSIVFIKNNSVTAEKTRDLTTTVMAKWSDEFLYLAFHCRFGKLTIYDPPMAEERWLLWEKDVVEAFIGADPDDIDSYKEFEVAPNNDWLDLDIHRRTKKVDFAWNSGWEHATRIDHEKKVWTCEMKIPLAAIDPRLGDGSGKKLEPGTKWRINLYRCDDSVSPRAYLAWNPPRCRSFHTPEAFGVLEFKK